MPEYRTKRINVMMTAIERRLLAKIARHVALTEADVIRQAVRHRAIELRLLTLPERAPR